MLRARQAREVVLTACGTPIESVPAFKHLRRLLTPTDDDRPSLHKNLAKAGKQLGIVSRVLVREGSNPRTMGMFYKAVVQSVLLFGSETWVFSDSERPYRRYCIPPATFYSVAETSSRFAEPGFDYVSSMGPVGWTRT